MYPPLKENLFPVLSGGDLWRDLNVTEDWGLLETRGSRTKAKRDTGDLAPYVAFLLQVPTWLSCFKKFDKDYLAKKNMYLQS